jgi:hypothetical protein
LIKIINKYNDSKVIYLDSRNSTGDGDLPGCCTSAVLYHNSVFKLLLQELDPIKGLYRQDYKNKNKKIVDHEHCLADWFLANLLAHYNIKVSSEAIVNSGRFDSSF